MIYDRLRVFVSSKMAELAPERAAIKEVLDDLNIDAWVFEQDAGARPGTIQESYKDELDSADLYLGVFWKGYGDYTIDEFEHAQKSGKDCLVYQKNGDDVAGRDPQLKAFLDRIGSVETGLTVQFFDTPEELREMVKRDAARWQMRIVRKYRESGPQRAPSGLPADPNLLVLRNKVQQFWIDGVLGRAIDAGLVDLSREPQSEATDQPWEAVLELPYEGSRVVDPGATIVDIFDEVQRSLLVLGHPGSGKTTTVLQLVRDLIKRSELDDSLPVPVMLNLSAWSPESRSLLTWIAKEISAKYQVPGRISRPWIEQDRLLLILDGLDEVAAGNREACVAAINAFCASFGFAGLVVTSRLDEYAALPVKLRTNGAICLQPLGERQIDAFLEESGTQVDGLRAVLKTDETLRELARSPLMLSVMSVAYRGRSAEEFQKEGGTSEERRTHLFETYVDRAFDERPTGQSYTREATTSWLSWLANRMASRNQTVFLIEGIQPGWLARRVDLAAYLAGFAALFGLVFGGLCVLYRFNPSFLQGTRFGQSGEIGWPEGFSWIAGCAIWALAIGMTDGMKWRAVTSGDGLWPVVRRFIANLVLFGLLWVPLIAAWFEFGTLEFEGGDKGHQAATIKSIPGPLAVLVAALYARRSLTRSIKTTESLQVNWKRASIGALLSLPAGLGAGAVVYFFFGGRPEGFVVWPMITALFGAIIGGLEPQVVKGKAVANQGMLLTLRSSLVAGGWAPLLSVAIVIACFVAEAIYPHEPGQGYTDHVITWALVAFAFFFINLMAWFGGLDFAKHYLVRAVIGSTRQGPYDFPRFLNEATRRNLMQQVGGGYMFVHRLLLDHFAAMDLAPPVRVESQVRGGGRPRLPIGIVAMSGLAFGGLALLLIGLGIGSTTAIVLGSIPLGIGAPWLIIRTSVASALRTVRNDEEEE